MREGGVLCVGYIDFGNFFMSCVKDVLWQCEEWVGVDPNVTDVVRTLHEEVTGQYETAHGLTEPYGIDIGTGQGCVNGAVRSKLLLTAIQRTVQRLCKGYKFRGEGRVSQLFFADDGVLLATSVADLQLAFDCC